jgi:hypothetical protein
VQGARVFFVAGPGSFPDVAFLTSGDGSFALSAPTAGSYSLGCVADDHSSATVSVEVPEGGVAGLEIRLEP